MYYIWTTTTTTVRVWYRTNNLNSSFRRFCVLSSRTPSYLTVTSNLSQNSPNRMTDWKSSFNSGFSKNVSPPPPTKNGVLNPWRHQTWTQNPELNIYLLMHLLFFLTLRCKARLLSPCVRNSKSCPNNWRIRIRNSDKPMTFQFLWPPLTQHWKPFFLLDLRPG